MTCLAGLAVSLLHYYTLKNVTFLYDIYLLIKIKGMFVWGSERGVSHRWQRSVLQKSRDNLQSK